jgi:hypothetical protein
MSRWEELVGIDAREREVFFFAFKKAWPAFEEESETYSTSRMSSDRSSLDRREVSPL